MERMLRSAINTPGPTGRRRTARWSGPDAHPQRRPLNETIFEPLNQFGRELVQ